MQQLTQKLKNGEMRILEVPVPGVSKGQVLVKNAYSLISAGTEGSTVKTARDSFIGKAKQRPQQVKQVIDTFKSQGPLQTYRAVMKKLEAYSPLGYSCVGEVVAVSPGNGNSTIRKGDWVACGGLSACHAEVVSVPEKLCVKLSPDTDFKQAAYNTLGAIAMQGVRQADLRLGECCAVIGLGLLGQLTCLLLRASGVRVVGIDINPEMVDIADTYCADHAFVRNQEGLVEKLIDVTGGTGFDCVIIAAATDSLDPINFAGAISRKNGSVVVVGAVPTGFDREPHYYKKELQLKMSCSYGPGRYDSQYEEKGIDYPYPYVRWTEQRNMQAFQELISQGKIDVGYLTTHSFSLDEAPAAYDMMMSNSEAFIGILIEYGNNAITSREKVFPDGEPQEKKQPINGIGVGFIGAGSYAQSHLLPNIPKGRKIRMKGVVTSSGTSSRSVADRFGFEFCSGEAKDILDNPEINTVFVATRHDTHAGFVLAALQAGKNVFVEKPLCMTEKQLDAIATLMAQSVEQGSVKEGPVLMVGYNRRFSPFAGKIRKMVQAGPVSMMYRVNAGAIPADSWIQDPETGGGRIVGEVCHFIDFLTYVNGSLPVSVHAHALRDMHGLNDTLTVSLQFENGSIGTVVYCANGNKCLSKELVEVHGHGCSAIIDDFKVMHSYVGSKKQTRKLVSQDKGQKNEVKAFFKAVESGTPPIGYGEQFSTSMICFKILESLETGQVVRV